MIIDTSISNFVEEDDVFDLSNISEYYGIDFSSEIRKRGQEYFDDGKVISCVQYNMKSFVGKVKGSASHIYTVNIDFDEEDDPIYECTCPCTFPCKHEYALLLAIENGRCSKVETKLEILKNEKRLDEIIELIPASELKEYILASINLDKVSFDLDFFNKEFNKYLPLQSYDYYYNKLYNMLVMDCNYSDLTNIYVDSIRQYISDQNFQEAFKIIKVIVEVYAECRKLDLVEAMELIPRIGMCLRIVYRKGNEKLKLEIDNWKNKMGSINYYDNYYLEDMFLTVGV